MQCPLYICPSLLTYFFQNGLEIGDGTGIYEGGGAGGLDGTNGTYGAKGGKGAKGISANLF